MLSSTYANVSIPPVQAGASTAHWLARASQMVAHALDVLVSVRPSQGLQEMATRCERLQPALARELRAAAGRVSEG